MEGIMLHDLTPELLADLFSDEYVYRPPTESESIIIEVAIGCSYSQCTFCTEQALKRFEKIPFEEVKRRIAVTATIPGNASRTTAYLTGENSFSFPVEELLLMLRELRKAFPHVHHVSMYSRVQDVLHKSKEELMLLKANGLGDLYIGIETGNEELLKSCRKGQTVDEVKSCFDILDELQIGYALSSIIGLGGVDLCWQHAVDTAKLYNQLHPKSIRIMTYTPYEGTILKEALDQGTFKRLPAGNTILEERLFLEHLTVEDCLIIGNNVSNLVSFVVRWPQDKETVLDALDEIITTMDLASMEYKEFDVM